jgi:hypothetical protein
MQRLVILFTAWVLASAPALACMPGASVADVDRVLEETKLSDADAAKVKKLRAQIVDQLARGDKSGAFASETEAMAIMGRKFELLTRGGCGNWVRNTN